MQYKISIILPVFNVEKYIEEALESIVRQSIGLENLEVIMIDDRSTDHSSQIMDEYVDRYDNFIAIHLPENSGGAGKPRNTGIERATGEYLMFLDPDDSYAPEACQTLYDKISGEKVDMVFGTFSVDGKKKDKNPEYYEIKIDTIDEHKTFLKGSPTLWARIYRREFILENDIRFPLIKAAQDSVFVAHTLLKARGIIYINKVITHYTDHRVESVTNKKDIKTLSYRIKAYSQIYDLCKENGKEEYFTSYILRDKLINWMKHFVFSDLTDLEQTKALKLSSPLFRKCVEHGLTFPPGLDTVAHDIINLKFDEAQRYLGKIKENQFKGRKKPSSPKYIKFNEVELPGEPRFKPKEETYDPAISERSSKVSKIERSVEASVDEIEASVYEIEASVDEMESILNHNIKKINTLKKRVNKLHTEFYRAEYENRRKPLSQRFPSLYILFKRGNGLKGSLRNIKAYKVIKKHGLLDIGFYLKNNQDVRVSGADPILHYIYYGYEEGRTPSPNFDANYYLENYRDVQQSKLNPLIHYALYGIEEGRIASIKKDRTPNLKKEETTDTKRDRTSKLEEEVSKPQEKRTPRKHDPNIARKHDRTNKHYDITIKVPSPYWDVAHNWGDYHMALALKKEFEKNNYETDIQMHSEWDEEDNADVVFVIRGKFEYEPKDENFNIMWNISHPDEVSIDEYNKYDHIFIASHKWAEEIKNKVDVPVQPLLQCTDPEIFYPDHSSEYEHELLFVGNSRKVFRKILKDLLPTDHDLAIYGKEWNFLDKKLVKGDHIPNNQLRKAYSSCKILLNDHWEDMRTKGFISNRLFDGFAAGAFIISDEISGAKETFEDALVTYSNSKELNQLIDYYLENEEERQELAQKGKDIIFSKDHTYENRVKQILETIHFNMTPDEVICPICKSRTSEFLPFGHSHTKNRQCPKCGAVERHRAIYLFLKDRTNIFHQETKMLHIAPERIFAQIFQKIDTLDYLPVDLNIDRPFVKEQMDIQNIHYPDDTFDFILTSHVLEHVPDDEKAINEFYRVLKPGGSALILVPINRSLKTTFEDPSYNTPELRLKHYGHPEHLRYYGTDFSDKLKDAGFTVDDSYLRNMDEKIRKMYGLNLVDILFYCKKPVTKKKHNLRTHESPPKKIYNF